jgi:hypothetical protein
MVALFHGVFYMVASLTDQFDDTQFARDAPFAKA